ncbi:MAG: hypothetical protein ACYC6M_16555 [Terriglobales bacterium]
MRIRVLLTASALALPLAGLSPASAAVPKTKPTYIVPCGKKAAKIWAIGAQGTDVLQGFAATNPCKQWLDYTVSGNSNDNPPVDTLTFYVAPGTHFNWTTHTPVSVTDGTPRLGFGTPPACEKQPVGFQPAGYLAYAGVKIYSYRKVINIPRCT